MELSAAFCRTQQAFHQDRADAAMLDNVRKVASKAATAWGIEAAAAEDRESRQDQPPIAADEAASLADRFEDEDDPMFSEKLDPMDQRSPNNSR